MGPKRAFFEEAFGSNEKEFLEILTLPEDYIIHRHAHLENGDRARLESSIQALTNEQNTNLGRIILTNTFTDINSQTNDPSLVNILKLY